MTADVDNRHGGDRPNLFRNLCGWGPLIALSIIKFVFFTCIYTTSMWLSPYESMIGFVNHLMIMIDVGFILYNFLSSVGTGGGFVPRDWRPENPTHEKFLQFCKLCNGFKAPRAHHCRVCRRCVMKMDHHCPWINNCVGHKNHRNFVYFLVFCIIGAFHSFILLCMGLHKAYNVKWYEEKEELFLYQLTIMGLSYPPPGHTSQIVHFSFVTAICAIFAIGLSLGVVIALGMLLYFQIQTIVSNETSIEKWIIVKAKYRAEDSGKNDWVYPYNLGWKENFKMLFSDPIGDGIVWPVLPGCHQFTLTIEQIKQKNDKRERQQLFVVIKAYSGRFFPFINYGCCTSIRAPLNTDPRLSLEEGNRVFVTRWSKLWLYGELENLSGSDVDPKKGWFPKSSVISCVRQERKRD